MPRLKVRTLTPYCSSVWGDFYEMFAEDARTAAAILGVVLTSRGGVPMCGIPYHSSSNYIAKLLAAGRKVAICEQIAPTAEEAKRSKLFKREVVRLITPGTIVETSSSRPRPPIIWRLWRST